VMTTASTSRTQTVIACRFLRRASNTKALT